MDNSKTSKFCFALVKKDFLASLIKNLSVFETGQKNNVPTSSIKTNVDIFSDVLP